MQFAKENVPYNLDDPEMNRTVVPRAQKVHPSGPASKRLPKLFGVQSFVTE